jgi:transcriptional regulator with XRE-family HTH domain
MLKENHLKEIRARRGMIQLRLSIETRIPQTKISLFENGWARPSPEEIRRMASVLEVAPEELGFQT